MISAKQWITPYLNVKKKKKKESQSHQDGKFVIVHLPTGSKATEKEPSAQKNLVVKASTEA